MMHPILFYGIFDVLVPVVNFVLLLHLLIRLQWVRSEFEQRRARFERIEAELDYLHRHTNSPRRGDDNGQR